MFQDYQMMLNKMMIEQMKMMRQQIKYSTKKQQKLKGKSQRIYDLLSELAKPDEEEKPEPKEEPAPEPEAPPAEPAPEEPAPNTTAYFENDYHSPTPPPNPPPPQPEPPAPPQYQQPYEQRIDELAGYVIKPSRRDRLNFKNFNI